MRNITIHDRTVEIRPMTRGENKSLKALGFGPIVFNPDMKTINDALDAVLSLVLNPDDLEWLDNQPNNVTNTVWREILNETYGSPAEIKN